MSQLLIAWTTCGSLEDAERLAEKSVASGLVACVQIEEGVRSIYKWKGEVQKELECRLCLKFASKQLDEVTEFVLSAHPYDVPEWVVIEPSSVSEGYLNWAAGE